MSDKSNVITGRGTIRCKKCNCEFVSTKYIKTGKMPRYCPGCKNPKYWEEPKQKRKG